jgi:hypothetical protein
MITKVHANHDPEKRRHGWHSQTIEVFSLPVNPATAPGSQIATASKINIRFQPLAFTEHGMVMLSAVLNSERSIQMSILVVEASCACGS